jgi:hypothetical protein
LKEVDLAVLAEQRAHLRQRGLPDGEAEDLRVPGIVLRDTPRQAIRAVLDGRGHQEKNTQEAEDGDAEDGENDLSIHGIKRSG